MRFFRLGVLFSATTMRRIAAMVGCLMAAFLLSAPPAARATDAVQGIFDRVAKMSFAEQQAWLEQLERRAARAAQRTLSADDAAVEQARTHDALRQKMGSWKTLRTVIEDIDAREKAATAALLRQYDARGGRRDDWLVVERAWADAGRRFEDQERLLDWLETALSKLAAKTQNPQLAPPAEIAKPQATMEKAKPPAETQSPRAPAAVQVNVPELEARIAGCNLALREFESGWDEKGTWNAERLEPLAERLKILIIRHNDLALLRDLAPPSQQAALPRLESPKTALSQLSARVAEARNRLQEAGFPGNESERKAESARLDRISRSLAAMAGK